MMFFRMKIGCEYPYSYWFIDSLYERYNSTNRAIDSKSLNVLMRDLGLNRIKSNKSLRYEPSLNAMRSYSFNKVNYSVV